MKKSIAVIIAFFTVLFAVTGIFSASASSLNGAVADIEGDITTIQPTTSMVPVSGIEIPGTGGGACFSCPHCGQIIEGKDAYSEHVVSCTTGTTNSVDYNDLAVNEIIDLIIDLLKSSGKYNEEFEVLFTQLTDALENRICLDDIEVILIELVDKLADSEVNGIDELIEALLIKIANLYEIEIGAGETATTAHVTAEDDGCCDCDGSCKCDCGEKKPTVCDMIADFIEKIIIFFTNIFNFLKL